ncbi:TPA: hypothetical protein DEP58_00115 [Patescibacteria group bacterium]|nr:MAG: hypothetical protein UU98_C0002G0039 [Parcubacteria group bacterium GW2011_GWD2_42_14]HCC04694.1 hypothetical protein [Patescibacteria group bacterium]
MILRAEDTLGSMQAFNDLYVYAYDLMRKAEGANKTVVLGEKPQKNGVIMEENFHIPAGHSDMLSSKGWTVLDILSFRPVIEKILALQKITKYPYPYLHDFSIPLIMSGIFATVHFCENFSASFDAICEHEAVKSFDIPIVYLE